jgi:hypothetical protein
VVRELLGPRDLTYAEAVRILGERIGKPDLKYVQLSSANMASALVQAGLTESFAGLYVKMTRVFNEGKVKPSTGRTPENTTATQFEDFADELARAMRWLEGQGEKHGKHGAGEPSQGSFTACASDALAGNLIVMVPVANHLLGIQIGDFCRAVP